MFMRFVNLKVKPDSAGAFERFYALRLAPALLEEPGCIFVRLIQSDSTPNDFLSFSLWANPAAAEAYESSGHFAALVEENEPFLEDSSEWKIQLSDDNTLEYKPVKEQPTVQAMSVLAGTDETDLTDEIGSDMYVRILSAKINSEKFDEIQALYDEKVTPTLLALDGCHGAYLIGSEGSEDILSITIWESKSNAEFYEASGTFEELIELTRPYMSSLYQWKMSLDSDKQSSIKTSEDLSVKGYHIVTGEQLVESSN